LRGQLVGSVVEVSGFSDEGRQREHSAQVLLAAIKDRQLRSDWKDPTQSLRVTLAAEGTVRLRRTRNLRCGSSSVLEAKQG